MRRLLFILGSLLCETSSIASDATFDCMPRWRFSDSMIQVVSYQSTIDGDTFKINIPGMPAVFGKGISVRIKGIDAPEMRSKVECEKMMAMAVAIRLEKLLSTASRVDLLNVERDKYFRLLADVQINGSIDIGKFFLENGWAVSYAGKTKPKVNWCKSLERLK